MSAAIVFCCDPLEPRKPDPSFQREIDAASALQIPRLLIDHDALDQRHDAAAAAKRVAAGDARAAAYRGWMLRADDYRSLYDALLAKSVTLINTPAQYAACHHGPEAYPHIAQWAAPMTSVPLDRIDDADAVRAALAPFGGGAVVLKDWVKSQAAGYWDEACFIPDASDDAKAQHVIARFRELQDTSLTGGLVFRSYVPLVFGAEWRAFVLDGRALGCWPRAANTQPGPPTELLAAIARRVPSRFASVDLAHRVDGDWLLIEVGDGQVSEIPDAAAPEDILGPLLMAGDGQAP